MSSNSSFNIVRFVPHTGDQEPGGSSGDSSGDAIAILLEEPFKLTVGIKPNINRGICSYKEFDKLDKMLGGVGSIEFWYTSDPTDQNSGDDGGGGGGGGDADVTISNIRIVDIEPLTDEVPKDDPPRPAKYRLQFIDDRFNFMHPRGGRLTSGWLNRSSTGTQTPDQTDVQADKTLNELIQLCLDAIDIQCDIPDLSAIHPPQDLKWFGTHAPSELGRLLAVGNCVLVLQTSGDYEIYQINDGEVPTFPDGQALPVVTLSGVDGRAAAVVFSSFPTFQLVTFAQDLTDTAWQIVYFDDKGVWKLIDDSKAFGTGTAIAEMNGGFKNTPNPPDQWGCYRYVRLDPNLFDPNISPIVPKTFADPIGATPGTPADPDEPDDGTNNGTPAQPDSNGLPHMIDLDFRAMIAVQDPATGMWNNVSDFVRIPITCKVDQNILISGVRLVKLPPGVTNAPSLEAVCIPLDMANDVEVRFTIVDSEWDGAHQVFRPKYFYVGFERDADGTTLTTLGDDDTSGDATDHSQAAEDAMNDDDTIVIADPSLLAMRMGNGSPDPINKSILEARCKAMAERYVKDNSNPPQILGSSGFVDVTFDGLVDEAEWDQARLATHVKVNGKFRPTGSYLSTEFRRLVDNMRESHPHEGKSQGQRSAMAQTASTPPNVLMGSYSSGGSGGGIGWFVAKLMPHGGADSTGPTVSANWKYDILAPDGITPIAYSVPLYDPTSTAAPQARILNLSTSKADRGLIFTVATDDGNNGTNPKGGPQLLRLWSCNERFSVVGPCTS